MRRFLVLLLFTGCQAQNWQTVLSAGFGSYHPQTFHTAAGTAQAGIGPRVVFGAAAGRRIGEHFAVEGAGTYQDGDFEISSGNVKTAFNAYAVSIHADVLGYLRSRSSPVRPFLAAGAGVKLYHGIETPAPRPLPQFGSFRKATDARALLTFGGGAEWSLTPRWAIRLDVRDYATPFPTSVIVPAEGADLGGWLHDLVATVGFVFR